MEVVTHLFSAKRRRAWKSKQKYNAWDFHSQDGVCTLHHPEDGVAGGEVQDASGALALRRLVKCWGVDVKVGMTKAQVS